ncbi:SDR family NAD(P)-dependent oxidoreductase [Sessilibacter corallicola]|uniref:SDR family oxidoreductase n=1 Tax=Sessilibacter corallicola TaxID=2904075 RepID=A0ABQ0AAD5_9GAMM|nr:SDR family oxidoreductase [Sessilibacter corallicola]MCE2029100.1 SDR family oxidoreductase [Sessilibacter corallicola]
MAENNANLAVVVTGGTKGIGRALVERFFQEGYTVITCARSLEDLDALKKSLEQNGSNKLYVKQADLSQKPETFAFAEFVLSLNLPIEVLINNTGVFTPGEVHTEDDGVLESQINTNLYSAYYLTRALIEPMKSQKRGHIFNMCSIASVMAYSNGGSYSISKFALYGFSKVLREEMKPFNIRVTSLLPGATYTDSWAGVDVAQERLMKPEDIAELTYTTYCLSERTVVEDLLIRPQLGDL